jgi:hypothetical protein
LARSLSDIPLKLTGFADALPWPRYSIYLEDRAEPPVELGYAIQVFDESFE